MTRRATPVSVAFARDVGVGGRRVDERHQGWRRAHFSVAYTCLVCLVCVLVVLLSLVSSLVLRSSALLLFFCSPISLFLFFSYLLASLTHTIKYTTHLKQRARQKRPAIAARGEKQVRYTASGWFKVPMGCTETAMR